MDRQAAAVETTVSAVPEAGEPNKVSGLENIKGKPSSSKKRINVRSLTLMAAGFVLLLAVGKSLAPFVKGAPRPAFLVRDQPQEQRPERDDWGLPSLEHFEQTLPPKLSQSVMTGGYLHLNTSNRLFLPSLGRAKKHLLLGPTSSALANARPLNWSMVDTPLPQKLRVTKVLDYYRWNLMVIAEDVETNREYSVNIPVIDRADCEGYDLETFQRLVRQTAREEEHAMLQACGEDHPYGDVRGQDWMDQVKNISVNILGDGTRSDVLMPKLKAAKVPKRWAELIVRLLEPQRGYRIGAFQVIREFPDLIENISN
ncbi:LOW QUALITY PROTEIN: uncharacterized protein EMH_0008530 [Eimeria mitis]|uniref:Uncharacterized protein n=1 Tax=Eimeria mitis TaxID=44415 RepID=U6K2Q0_9EIME|nr:LOW QUALITY PROTEIN: uncharacterized protein EMH_0008530 [Eimeria mitis]CDJ31261.1 hypothetical protein EMH_0008530 [Eimeria mitis]